MASFRNRDRLIILDADGTLIDAFSAIERTFACHGMDIGDLARFQKRRKLFKYLGGLKEFPANLGRQLGKKSRRQLLATLTEVYREEASLYPGIAALLSTLLGAAGIRVGLITRNVTNEPEQTLAKLFLRHGVDCSRFDYLACLPLNLDKTPHFRIARERFDVNPARCYACGDEARDFSAAITSGMHPFVVSYGFEDHRRLTHKFAVPEEVISRTPQEFAERVLNALDL